MLKRVTPPVDQPLSLTQVRDHLRLTVVDDDPVLTGLIAAACDMCEAQTGRALMPQEWAVTESEQCRFIYLRKLPVTAITSVKHIDDYGDELAIDPAEYRLTNPSDSAPAWVEFSEDAAIPAGGILRVVFACGYTDVDAVPQALKQWMLLQIGHWYMNRESVNIGNITSLLPYVDGLLDTYRIWNL
ncbi:head-tail connector protein [Nitrosomonas eutropha]|uniref:PhiE125 gp8 family phage protein n=2 Tax=Nitrosomonas eutropha TaxID=916 RepID=A0ABX5M9R1_9PROT|nr:hypothetical protein [Nitrosomonas eutropha]ABI59713.1 hypothetical protein Neut_1467 [Nitrosomonas eutropha C91]PXV82488.1 putative phiE125 gp8 family phage protein [Nitrosomonas eutropha]